ncbi:MAG: hypothetical protein O3A10_11345 [Chloroflexi bacterium]|nr:hypothetical protein [Chloroflexota bacterium]MDA1147011.1 hypothetical protein [Chloroflexota bacterium]
MTLPPEPPDFDDEARQPGLPLDPPPAEHAPEADALFEPPWERSRIPPPSSSGRGEPISRAGEPPLEPSSRRGGPTPPGGAFTGREQVERPFAPVIFDDDERGGPPPPFAEYDDSGVLRVLGVIVLLAIAIAVLVLPPISILDRGGSDNSGLSVQARGEMPSLPAGLTALSLLYDLKAEETSVEQALWTLSIKLTETTEDDRNLAFYTNRDGEWFRLTAATLVAGGNEAEAEVGAIPQNVAVLRRTAFERTLGLIVEAGQTPDPAALAANAVVAVMGGTLAIGDDGAAALAVQPGAVATAGASGATVYLGVSVQLEAQPSLDQLLATEPALVAHVGELVAAVTDADADGLYLEYLSVDPTRRAALTRLVTQLSAELSAAGLGLVVGIPTPTTADTGAYDWAALSAAAAALWLTPPADPSVYYEQLALVLDAQQAAGVDLDHVSLVMGRRSHLRDSEGVSSIGRYDALGRAALLEAGADGGIAVGDLVSLTAVNTSQELGNSGLRWDSPSRSVSFSFAERGGPRTVWVENTYSMLFRIDLARRYDMGGVVIADAQADETLPAIWEALDGYLESGAIALLQPYGPYLTSCWQALDGVIEGEAGNCWADELASGVATWRAPATPGTYQVRLVVSDGEAFVGRELALRVTEDGEQADPTPEPTEEATPEPTAEATETPTDEPTAEATTAAGGEPTAAPTAQPTAQPTVASTPVPSGTQGPPGPGGNE